MKTYYVDTSVLFSALSCSDTKHELCSKVLKEIREEGGRLIISTYTLAEFVSVICRRILHDKWKLIEPLDTTVKWIVENLKEPREICKYLASITISLLEREISAVIVEDLDLYTLEKLNNLPNIVKIFKEAIELSWINIRFKDLTHIVVALLLSEKYSIDGIVTADKENFNPIKDVVGKMNLKIIVVE
jgi:predicted nucleic acid-binding protein